MLSPGEDAEQLKFPFTAGQDANGTSFLENQPSSFLKS